MSAFAPDALTDALAEESVSQTRTCAAALGETPSDASKVKMPDDEQPEDPANKYFR